MTIRVDKKWSMYLKYPVVVETNRTFGLDGEFGLDVMTFISDVLGHARRLEPDLDLRRLP
jgi:hypothetical protein